MNFVGLIQGALSLNAFSFPDFASAAEEIRTWPELLVLEFWKIILEIQTKIWGLHRGPAFGKHKQRDIS